MQRTRTFSAPLYLIFFTFMTPLKYTVLKEFILVRPNHVDGDLTMNPGSTFSPDADGFEGTVEELNSLVGAQVIAEIYEGPMAKYKILGQIEALDEDGNGSGVFLKVGSIHELPKGALDEEVEKGLAELVPEETVQTGTPAEEAAVDETADVEKKKLYMGKEVISDTTREVNGVTYHVLRLEDGSTHDLTVEDYATHIRK